MNKIGVLIVMRPDTDIDGEMKKVRDIGCECCQITMWNPELFTDEVAKKIVEATKKYGIEISTLWVGWSGPTEWNFTGGPMVLGIVPEAYRMKRSEEIIKGADFAVKIGAPRIATHVGFLPENMHDPSYYPVIAALRNIVRACRTRGVNFLFETGQETPVALLRVIEELGEEGVGINMDTANLILYGKGNSADAITVFGKYVMDTHIKDGFYPTSGKELGREVKVGEGMANIPEVIKRLRAVGYRGNFIIEREISGEEQINDIKDTVIYLRNILSKIGD